MPDDTRSAERQPLQDKLRPDPIGDEDLVTAYRAGDPQALDILIARYYTKLLGYLFANSFFKDEDYLSDVRHNIIVHLLEGIRPGGKFTSRGPGSFSAYLYTIAGLECLNADKKRRRAVIPISQAFPESESPFPEENILFKITPDASDIEYARMKLARAFKNLNPEEVKLLQLSIRMKYKDIIKMPEFSEYKSVDSLMNKVYNIKKKIKNNPDPHGSG